jgi:hypothetical protein
MASDEPLQRSWSSTCFFAPRMSHLVISAGSSDAVWLCKVAERQMLRPSSVPPRPLRLLRDPTRYRIDLVGARPAEKQRVENLLAMPASSCRWSPATSYLRGLLPGDTGCPDRRGTRPRGSRGHGPEPDAGYNLNVAHGGVLSGAGRTACPRQLRHSSLALERQILNLCRALLLDRRFR